MSRYCSRRLRKFRSSRDGVLRNILYLSSLTMKGHLALFLTICVLAYMSSISSAMSQNNSASACQPTKKIQVVDKNSLPNTQKTFTFSNETFCIAPSNTTVSFIAVVADRTNIGKCTNFTSWSNASAQQPVPCYVSGSETFRPAQADDPGRKALNCSVYDNHVTCVLGAESNCTGKMWCNGPLKPGVNYGLKLGVRNATNNVTYSDPVFFTAGSGASSNASSVTLLGLALLVLIKVMGQ